MNDTRAILAIWVVMERPTISQEGQGSSLLGPFKDGLQNWSWNLLLGPEG